MENFLTFIGNLISNRQWAFVLLYSFVAYGYINGVFDLETPLPYLLAISLGGVFNFFVVKGFEWAAQADSFVNLWWKHSRLTDWQIIILGIALADDRSWIHLYPERERPVEIRDAVQRFLEARLAYMDVFTLRFHKEYWRWINNKRRRIISTTSKLISSKPKKLLVSVSKDNEAIDWIIALGNEQHQRRGVR